MNELGIVPLILLGMIVAPIGVMAVIRLTEMWVFRQWDKEDRYEKEARGE